MTDVLRLSILQENTCDNQGKTKFNNISKEVFDSTNPKMIVRYKMKSGIEYNANSHSAINVHVGITRNNEVKEHISCAKCYIFLEHFERPYHRLHCNGLSGSEQFCHKATGAIISPVDCQGIHWHKSFSVQIVERDPQSAMAAFNNLRGVLRDDLVQLLEPPPSMSPFVRFRAVLLYQTDTSGDLEWHVSEAVSEAFLYKPLPPRVVSVSSEGPLTLKLNRPLIEGYDELRGAIFGDLDLPSSALRVISDRIEVDPNSQPTNDAAAYPTTAAAIRLIGSSGGHQWLPSERDRQLRPSKRDRQLRVFNADELDDVVGF